MDIARIKETINRLKEELTEQNNIHPLKEDILLTYTKKVIEDLNQCLDDHQNANELLIKNKLKSYLKNNWDLVKNSLLSYIALPDHAITQLLGDVAVYVAENDQEIKDAAASAALMPNVACASLEGEIYSGQATDGITTKILENLNINIPLKINSFAELTSLLKDISATEMLAISALKGVPEKIVEVISTIENLILLTELSDAVFRSLLLSVKDVIKPIIQSPKDLLTLLIPLNVNQCEIVCEVLKGYFPAIIKDAYDFNFVLQFLTIDQCTVMCVTLREHLLAIIKNASDFNDVLQSLSDERRTVIYEALKDHMPAIIKDSRDFNYVLRQLTADQCADVCAILRYYLSDIIKNASDFNDVLESLTDEQRTVVYKAQQHRLRVFIDGNYNFNTVGAFNFVLQFLTADQCTELCSNLQLSSIFKKASDFNGVFETLSPVQRTVVYEALKEHLHKIVKTSYDFSCVLKNLTADQCTAVCSSIQRPHHILKNKVEFNYVLRQLTAEQCTAACATLKEHCHTLIKNNYDFSCILKNLGAEQCTAVCTVLKEHLYTIIENGRDFNDVLKNLTAEQCTAVCTVLKEHLHTVIENGRDFNGIFKNLTVEQCTAVCTVLKEHLHTVIENDRDFNDVLKNLTAEQHTVLCESLFNYAQRSPRSRRHSLDYEDNKRFNYTQPSLKPRRHSLDSYTRDKNSVANSTLFKNISAREVLSLQDGVQEENRDFSP